MADMWAGHNFAAISVLCPLTTMWRIPDDGHEPFFGDQK